MATPPESRSYGLITCGAAVGARDFQLAYLEGEARRLCAEASGTIPRVVDHLLLESAHAASIALYLSLQCRIDYLCQTHLPSLTKALVQRVDEALQAAYSKVLGYDVLDPFGVPRPDGTRPPKDPGFIRARARLKTKHGGIGFRPHDERYPFLNALHTTIPSMAGGACQAGLSKTASTLFNNAPTQRKRFKTREEFQTAALRSRGAPLRTARS